MASRHVRVQYSVRHKDCSLLVSRIPYKMFLYHNIHIKILRRTICIFARSCVLIMLTLLELTFLLCIKGYYYYSYSSIIISYSFLYWQLMSLDSFIHIVRFLSLIICSMNRSERHAKKIAQYQINSKTPCDFF